MRSLQQMLGASSHGRISGGLLVWDIASGQPITPPMTQEYLINALVTADDKHIVTEWEDNVEVWDIQVPNGNLLELVCDELRDFDLNSLSDRFGVKIKGPICGPQPKSAPIDWRRTEQAPRG